MLNICQAKNGTAIQNHAGETEHLSSSREQLPNNGLVYLWIQMNQEGELQ
jgi:hypothetical protein